MGGDVTVSTLGALTALVIAIVLILKKYHLLMACWQAHLLAVWLAV